MQEQQVSVRRELSTAEASQLSGLSRNHITLLLRQGKLEGHNFGHRLWTVYADSLEHYMATPHKSGPKGPHKKSTEVHQDTTAFSEHMSPTHASDRS
jgi:excisionase family DNA binding protein